MGCGLVASTERAKENREYVRSLLKEKQPEFAALLESLELELRCPVCGTRLLAIVSGVTQ